MSNFITYAQNFEDLMLWRALRDVGEGFYIDVGAADPDEDSVTRAFYDRGWHGINVEPTPEHFAALQAARPRDTTLQCLVGAQDGTGTLHHFADTGLSTTDVTFAARHVNQGREEAVLSLPILTLAEICRRHTSGAIHFLKIDVEGGEANVLRGADFASFRPWIVVVEATEPGSQVPNWSGWEHFLVDANYRFAWFDGLNRFYIAAEHWDALSGAFAAPPNVFDLWVQPRGKQRQALNFAFDEIGHLRSELEAAQHHIAMTSSANELAQLNLRNEVDRVHAVMLSERAEVAKLREESGGLRQDVLRARAEVAQQSELIEQYQQSVARLRKEADKRASEATPLRAEVARLNEALAIQSHARHQLESQLVAVYQSHSWRASAPLRGVAKLSRGEPVMPKLQRVVRGGAWRIINIAARLPGSHVASRIFRRAMPRTYTAIHDRYMARRGVMPAGPLASQANPIAEEPRQQAPAEADMLTQEEKRVQTRMSASSPNK